MKPVEKYFIRIVPKSPPAIVAVEEAPSGTYRYWVEPYGYSGVPDNAVLYSTKQEAIKAIKQLIKELEALTD